MSHSDRELSSSPGRKAAHRASNAGFKFRPPLTTGNYYGQKRAYRRRTSVSTASPPDQHTHQDLHDDAAATGDADMISAAPFNEQLLHPQGVSTPFPSNILHDLQDREPSDAATTTVSFSPGESELPPVTNPPEYFQLGGWNAAYPFTFTAPSSSSDINNAFLHGPPSNYAHSDTIVEFSDPRLGLLGHGHPAINQADHLAQQPPPPPPPSTTTTDDDLLLSFTQYQESYDSTVPSISQAAAPCFEYADTSTSVSSTSNLSKGQSSRSAHNGELAHVRISKYQNPYQNPRLPPGVIPGAWIQSPEQHVGYSQSNLVPEFLPNTFPISQNLYPPFDTTGEAIAQPGTRPASISHMTASSGIQNGNMFISTGSSLAYATQAPFSNVSFPTNITHHEGPGRTDAYLNFPTPYGQNGLDLHRQPSQSYYSPSDILDL